MKLVAWALSAYLVTVATCAIIVFAWVAIRKRTGHNTMTMQSDKWYRVTNGASGEKLFVHNGSVYNRRGKRLGAYDDVRKDCNTDKEIDAPPFEFTDNRIEIALPAIEVKPGKWYEARRLGDEGGPRYINGVDDGVTTRTGLVYLLDGSFAGEFPSLVDVKYAIIKELPAAPFAAPVKTTTGHSHILEAGKWYECTELATGTTRWLGMITDEYGMYFSPGSDFHSYYTPENDGNRKHEIDEEIDPPYWLADKPPAEPVRILSQSDLFDLVGTVIWRQDLNRDGTGPAMPYVVIQTSTKCLFIGKGTTVYIDELLANYTSDREGNVPIGCESEVKE